MFSSSSNIQIRTKNTLKSPITVMEIVTNVVYVLSLVIVMAIIIKCLSMAVYVSRNDLSESVVQAHHHPKGDRPCCLPFKFQAVITPLATFDVSQKHIMRVYRDWKSRLQAMELTSFDDRGNVQDAYIKTIYNYKHNTAYRFSLEDKKCVTWEIDQGMLEPCMPENAQYLGKSYIGFHDNKREFSSFYFRRTDKNRNIEMTIAVTSEDCVPVMEHIKGKMGSANSDSLVFFSNVTSLQNESVFEPPKYCFEEPDK